MTQLTKNSGEATGGHLLHDLQSLLRGQLWIDMLLLNHLDSHIQLTHLSLVHLHTYRTIRLKEVTQKQTGQAHGAQGQEQPGKAGASRGMCRQHMG